MKVVQINAVVVGSVGRIGVAVSELLSQNGIENYLLYSLGKTEHKQGIKYGPKGKYFKFQALYSRVFANNGFNSRIATYNLLKHLDKIKPDVIHFHNIHNHAVHLNMLFNYIRKHNIKTYWTFHDCWAFTGYCSYFDLAKCDKWKTGCYKCPQLKGNSFLLDRSKTMWKRKKKMVKGIDLTIVTPSEWLAGLVRESFLSEFPVKVINNGIDLSKFRPIKSDFRERYNIGDKYIILGVAFDWAPRKGLDVFLELIKMMDKSKYQFVLVGTTDAVDSRLPDGVISIHRTNSQEELAEIYSAADVFANPTREENYPTVHMEAVACGTPVVTFNTGGCKEMLNEKTGIVVDVNDIEGMRNAIIAVCEENALSEVGLVDITSDFNQDERFKDYLNLYIENN